MFREIDCKLTKLRTEPNSFEFAVFLNSATIAHELVPIL
jgi:hypothetical protein